MPLHLNWKELELLIHQISPEIKNLFVDRVIVPERKRYPMGYLRGEWGFRLTGRNQEGVLLINIRPQHPSIAWRSGKGPKSSAMATHSPFDLTLSKHLKGAKLLDCVAFSRERAVVLWFSEEGKPNSQLGLVLVLIPAAPEAFLVSVPSGEIPKLQWPIIARSRTVRDESKSQTHYYPPSGLSAPPHPSIRTELVSDSRCFYDALEQEKEIEAFELRKLNLEKSLRQRIKHAQDRLKQSEVALKGALNESDWQLFGDLLKGSLGQNPEERNGGIRVNSRTVMDYSTGLEVTIPCDLKLDLKGQIEKFYSLAKRKQRRIQEARSRIENFNEVIAHLQTALDTQISTGDWNALEGREQLAGIHFSPTRTGAEKPSSKKSVWLGKSFTSKDGFLIYVGRSKDENLELTFKHSRGNDLWMHVRGRPGAHVLIPLQAGKSAPLDTLLDAATLTIHYSGGQSWGKTEVDYTYKKYVKRIKDSSEASYTHNKTLLIEPDPMRTRRLLGDKSGN